MRVVNGKDRDDNAVVCRECGSYYWHKEDCRTGATAPIDWDTVGPMFRGMSVDEVASGLAAWRAWSVR